MKAAPLLGMTIAVALIVAPTVAQQPPLLVIWNASPSVPVGLYLVTKASPRVGDLVVVRLPPVIAAFAARRGYLPRPLTSSSRSPPLREILFANSEIESLCVACSLALRRIPTPMGTRCPPGKVAAFSKWERFSSWPIIPQASTAATSVRSIPHQSRDAPFSSGLTGLRVDTRLAVAVRGGGLPAPLTPAMSPNKINIRPR